MKTFQRIRPIPFSLLIFAALPGAAPGFAQSLSVSVIQPETVRYRCDAERSFQVSYAQEVAQLKLDEVNTIPLRRVTSESGIRFSNGSTTLYSKGNEAWIEEGGRQTYRNCIGQSITAEATTRPTTSYIAAYQCANHQFFEVRYQSENAELVWDGGRQSVNLAQVRSASGVRYSDGQTTLFTKGNTAFVQVNGEDVYTDCMTQEFSSRPAESATEPAPHAPAQTVTPAPAAPNPVRGMW